MMSRICYFVRKNNLLQHFHKGTGLKVKGRRRDTILKAYILSLKTQKALENQGLLCQGAKLLLHYELIVQKCNL